MKKLLTLLIVVSTLVTLTAPVMAVDVLKPACNAVDTADPATCADAKTANSASDDLLLGKNGILTKGISIFAIVLGVAAIIVILIAAVRFITSNGDTATVVSSRNWIIFAVVGLVVAGLAQSIVVLVLSKIGGA